MAWNKFEKTERQQRGRPPVNCVLKNTIIQEGQKTRAIIAAKYDVSGSFMYRCGTVKTARPELFEHIFEGARAVNPAFCDDL